MSFSRIIVLTCLLVSISNAFSWRGHGHGEENPLIESADPNAHESSATDLTFRNSRPLYYEQGLQKLRSFRGKPVCQQTAAKILVSECQNLDKTDADAEEAELMDDALYAYAVSLAICQLDLAKAEIPPSCARYREGALLTAYERGNYKALHGTHDEVQACVSGFYNDGRSWTTLSNIHRDGREICRAARYDIDRDRIIETNIKVTSAMRDIFDQFSKDMFHTSEIRKQQDEDMNEMVRSWLTQLQMVKEEDTAVSESAKHNLENLDNGVKSASEIIFVVQNAFSELIETGRKAVNEHENAVALNKEIAVETQSGLDIVSIVNKDLAILLQVSKQQNEAIVELNGKLITLVDHITLMDGQVNGVSNSLHTMSADLQNLNDQHEQTASILERTVAHTADLLDHTQRATESLSIIVKVFGGLSSGILFLLSPSTWLTVILLSSMAVTLILRQFIFFRWLAMISAFCLTWYNGPFLGTIVAPFYSCSRVAESFISVVATKDSRILTVAYIFVCVMVPILVVTGVVSVIYAFCRQALPRVKFLLETRRSEKVRLQVQEHFDAIRNKREANEAYYG